MKNQDFIERVWVKIRMEKGVRRIHTATKLPVSRKQTHELVKAMFEALRQVLESGEEVSIPGFGKFSIKRHPEGSMVFDLHQKTRVPRRANRMKAIRFKPSLVLLDAVNNGSTTKK